MKAAPSEDEPLLSDDQDSAVNGVKVYGTRWWVLFQLSFLSFNQSLFWITFSPVTANAKAFYGVSTNTVTWWMNIGVLSAILAFLVTSKYLAARGTGLKTVCTGSVLAQAVATVLRLVPLWIGGSWGPRSTFGIVCVYIAQFIIGVVGPMVMSAPPLLSNVWFPAKERATATAIGTLCNSMGSAGGFLLGPLLVKAPNDIPLLLYTHAAIAVANAILLLAYFPGAPPLPPSHSSGAERAAATASAGGEGSFGGVWAVLTNGSFLTIAIGFGTLNGVFNVWTGSFDEILKPLGPEYDQITCGWLGFGSTMAMIVGGICTGFVMDLPSFGRSFSTCLRVGAALTLGLMALFTVAMPTYFSSTPLIVLPFGVVASLIVGSGFTLGCCVPIAYEAAAEMTFPAPESTSANVIVLILNVAAFIYLFVTPPLISSDVLNIVVCGCALLAFVLVMVAKIDYVRSDYEKAQVHHGGSVQSEKRHLMSPP